MVRSFRVDLCSQAGVCKFTTQCPRCDTNVNYTEHILCDVLTHGLADSEIQLDLLGDKKPGYNSRRSTPICGGQVNGQLVASSKLRGPMQLAVNIEVPKTQS